LKETDAIGVEEAIRKYYPEYFDIIFSPKRAAGLLFLDPMPGEIVVDAGCMWGALTVPLARAGCTMISIDQTFESLLFLNKRIKEEDLTNVHLICSDLKKIKFQEGSIDKAVVNGVLEWIPEMETIELKKYFGRKASSSTRYESRSPRDMQQDFLKNLFFGLKDGGTLYLAIENRYDLLYFFGLPDPHCDIKFITFMPRFIQNIISRILLKRPYVNWLYSPHELKKLVKEVGFCTVNVYYAFPHYQHPDYVLTKNGMRFIRPFRYANTSNKIKRAVMYCIEEVIYRRMKLAFFSPSLIVVAQKGEHDGTDQ
jgi:SAM-dependent methyltransferase